MKLEEKSINALRFLGVDMINRANSGHPGIVLGAAPMLYTLYTKHMNFDPKEKNWMNRDRFVLSAGHGSALIYSMLHLAGYDLPMNELKKFRQWESKTAGHPEYMHTDGIEATTGPLGQGIGMAVGMAIGEKYTAAKFNKENLEIVNHHTYSLCGDGDLQEGVAQEAASLAGHLGLSKLIVLFDSNDIQLDGPVEMANSENTKEKFIAMNWNYILVEDGEDLKKINNAIKEAKKQDDKPTLIEVKTKIGKGSPVEGKSAAHGAPLGDKKTIDTRKALNWNYEPFEVPQDVYDNIEKYVKEKRKNILKWKKQLEEYKAKYPEDYEILMQISGEKELQLDFDKVYSKIEYVPGEKEATRASSGNIIKELQKSSPLLIGGSADLTASTKIKGIDGNFEYNNPKGRNINFGVREHAMAAITNGIVLSGLKGFAGGFFIFSDYMKPAMRLSALMEIPTAYGFTHDSIAVGEDGPTHQPVEQLAGLRAIPNFNVLRPADGKEVKGAWKIALTSKKTPTAVVFTRQGVPQLAKSSEKEVEKGAYVISPEKEKIDALIIATGSEVSLALESQKALLEEGIDVRVVSMPSMELFDAQEEGYKKSVLPEEVDKRLSIEMASALGWGKYVGLKGKTMSVDKFGASAKGSRNVEEYGFTVENVVKTLKSMM
ncbi:MAG: transketolase [Eubacteriales bacterium]